MAVSPSESFLLVEVVGLAAVVAGAIGWADGTRRVGKLLDVRVVEVIVLGLVASGAD